MEPEEMHLSLDQVKTIFLEAPEVKNETSTLNDIKSRRATIYMSDVTTQTNTEKMMMIMAGSSSLARKCKPSILDRSSNLPEDVWIDIFSRLPLNFTFKHRCVSKQWLSFLSKPSIIARLCNSLSPPLWTLFYQCHYDYFATASPNIHYKFISDHDGFSFKFLQQDKICLLGSSNGLVLCSANLKDQSIYYVCNPLTKKWVSLPPPTLCYPNRFFLYGFTCDYSSQTFTSTFKVFRIPKLFGSPTTNNFDIEIFSSDTGVWKIHKVACPPPVTLLYTFSRNAVTLNGILYWLEGRRNRIRNRIISYNFNNKIDTGHKCRLINLPLDIGHNEDLYRECLGESEGFICYCQIQSELMTLSMWVLEEDYSNGGCVWHLVHNTVELKDIFEAEIIGRLGGIKDIIGTVIRPLAFHPTDRNVVILSCHTFIFTCNIQTRRSELLRQANDDLFGMWVLPLVFIPKPTILPPSSWSTSP